MAQQYRTKPDIVSAVQVALSKEGIAELMRFKSGIALYPRSAQYKDGPNWVRLNEGDWLVQDSAGLYTALSHQEFIRLYEVILPS